MTSFNVVFWCKFWKIFFSWGTEYARFNLQITELVKYRMLFLTVLLLCWPRPYSKGTMNTNTCGRHGVNDHRVSFVRTYAGGVEANVQVRTGILKIYKLFVRTKWMTPNYGLQLKLKTILIFHVVWYMFFYSFCILRPDNCYAWSAKRLNEPTN